MALQGTEMRAEAAHSLSLSLSASEANLLWPFVRVLRRRGDCSESCYPSGANCTPTRARPSHAFYPSHSTDPRVN